TIFKLASDGSMIDSQLIVFDGINAYIGNVLVQDPAGNLYGTTYGGGPHSPSAGFGPGTIFKRDTNGTLSTLVHFDGTNGAGAGIILHGLDGNFYGETQFGGPTFTPCCDAGHGTVYRMTPEGVLTSLFALNQTNGSDMSALAQGTDGFLYGTTI